jgi:hypothetical protein
MPRCPYLALVVAVAAFTLPTAAGAAYECLPFHIPPQPAAIAEDGSTIKAVLTEWPGCVTSTCYGPIIVFKIDADGRAAARKWRIGDQLSMCNTPAQLHKHRSSITNLDRGGTVHASLGQIIHLLHGH